jgi:galactokinase
MDRFAGTSANKSVRRAIAAASSAFGGNWLPDRVAIAPGRIELLGNHVDYNGGPVLAAAIDRFIVVATRDDAGPPGTLRAVAADAQSGQPTSIDAATLGDWRNAIPPPQWSDYLRGLLAALGQRNVSSASPSLRLPSSVAIAGDVPIGFGVSSSAALCVALTLALVDGLASSEELVLLAQEAEHRAGTPCGTMDQSASVAGGVIAFNGADLTVERLSPTLGDLAFAVVDSGVERSLSTSSYPTRVAESRAALALAQQGLGIELSHLAALSKEQLADLNQRKVLPDTLFKRVRHVLEETARVREGRQAMVAGDWSHFGQLMTASGQSSATLYEISHPQVEALVADARQIDGVLGARMMGGGEGGSVLILASRSAIADLEASLRAGYFRRHGMDKRAGLIHVCSFAPGAALLSASDVAALA